MKVYRDFSDIDIKEGVVLTVGTFDGVHRGHHVILDKLKEISKENNLKNMLITFHPHPQIVLQKPELPPVKLLTTMDERIELFKKAGLDSLLIIPFTYEFSQTTPEVFVKDYLVKYTNLKFVLTGYDHLFGKNRKGNFDLLKQLGSENGFEAYKLDALEKNDGAISSTRIRKALLTNEIETANEMLGYQYNVIGTVVHGQARAREMGYPTANIKEINKNKLLPANGVYFVKSEIDGELLYGMANIGTRPTLTNDIEETLEVNYFNFDKDIYDKEVRVHFINFIRKEKKFKSVDDLISQIKEDEKKCLSLKNNLNM